ncbi:MAG: MG2 domain-containing protein, partial [Chloroflexota bacterium]|nr:MG2 domain-containing protein [Chloroflexota bacterium]
MQKSRLRWFWIGALIVVILLLVGAVGATVYAARLSEYAPDQETLVYGQTKWAPGSQAALRVLSREVGDASPIADAKVRVALKPQAGGRAVTLFEGVTDETGSAEVNFEVPADAAPQSILIVETRSPQGRDKVEREITIERDYKVLLSTDKPIYQPGQLIHIRALALGAFDLVPAAEQPLELIITDAKGNKVFRRTLTTSEYGVAAMDFQLANEVNTGNYKLEAILGNTTSEKTVLVQRYVLPKFKVDAEADRSFYLPGEHVTGVVNVNYFFGKPVDEGRVVLTGYTFDVQLNEIFRLEGETDADGHYDFAFDLPDHLVGGGLEEQLATFIVEIAVTDGAEQTERVNLRLPVARQHLLIEAVPESGDLAPGVENIVYLVTATPDGQPVPAELTIQTEGQTYMVESGEQGLAEWRFTPSSPQQQIHVMARDAQGHEAARDILFEAREFSPVLLRPAQAIARVGETLHVDIFSQDGTGSLYLDIIREGQTISTRALEPQNGHAQVDIDLTPEFYGTVELHAYTIERGGEIRRDTRLVVVDAPRDLAIDIQADKETYPPGAQAALDFSITGVDGAGVPAVVGLSVVDESVFALQEQDPGFLKLYFLLEKELMQPKYDLHGFSFPALLRTPEYEEGETPVSAAQDAAAQASLAGTTMGGGHSLAINTREEKLRVLRERKESIFRVVGRTLLPALLLFPVGIAALVVLALRREEILGRSIWLALVVLTGLVLLVSILPTPEWVGGGLERLGYWIEQLSYSPFVPGMLALWGLLGFIAWIALGVRAVRRREAVPGAALLLLLLYGVSLVLLVFLDEPPEWLLLASLWAFLLLPVAFLLWAAGELWQRRSGVALGAFALVGLTLAAPLLGVSGGRQEFGASAPVMLDGGMWDGEVAVVEKLVEVELLVEGAAPPMEMPTPAV